LSVLGFTALVALGSFAAGLLGALTGLGGGVVIVPLLVVAFGIDLPYAIGASLVAVIASSSGSASAYVREGYSNVRIAMLLEIATTVGALAGAALVALEVIPAGALSVTFGAVLAASALAGLGEPPAEGDGAPPDPLARRLGLDGEYPTPEGPCPYRVRRVPAGFALMFLAGALSGLLGIGSGALKVLAMDRVMAIPFKVSTTTSNFMIGVTAAASAAVYLGRGYIDPALALPVVLGVLAGSRLGAWALLLMEVPTLRAVFTVVILLLAAQMIYRGAFAGG
jgi:uncharacterized membrane protein YfcA